MKAGARDAGRGMPNADAVWNCLIWLTVKDYIHIGQARLTTSHMPGCDATLSRVLAFVSCAGHVSRARQNDIYKK